MRARGRDSRDRLALAFAFESSGRLRAVTQPLSYHFLLSAQRNLIRVNEHLGRGPGRPGGGVDPDASDQDVSNHAALVELTEALENFENWAVELSVRLQDAGLVELVREE